MYMVCSFGLPDGQTFRFPDTTGRHLSEQSDISRPEVNPFANMPFCRIGESACQAEENRTSIVITMGVHGIFELI